MLINYDHNHHDTSGWIYLTPREWEIVWWIVRGYKNEVIAEKLYVGRTTVERHINSIYSKLMLDHTQNSEVETPNPRAAICWLAYRDKVYEDFECPTEPPSITKIRANIIAELGHLRTYSAKLESAVLEIVSHSPSRYSEIINELTAAKEELIRGTDV